MKTKKNQIWNFNNEIDAEVCGEGVKRKILAYADEMMCVENHFEKGAIGALHHHPHTQITYVVSGHVLKSGSVSHFFSALVSDGEMPAD